MGIPRGRKRKEEPGPKCVGEEIQSYLTLPYVAGLSERIKSTFKCLSIDTCFKPENTLRSILVHVKDKTPKEKCFNLVYEITCGNAGCREETYIGETKQSLKARLREHRQPNIFEAQNSAVFNHLAKSGHSFSNEDVTILDREELWFKRGLNEAVWERIENPSLNRKGGPRFKLSHVWDQTLQCVSRRLSRNGTFIIRPDEGR